MSKETYLSCQGKLISAVVETVFFKWGYKLLVQTVTEYIGNKFLKQKCVHATEN